MNTQFEDLIEQLYWEFDDLRSKKTKSERDVFKEILRKNSKTLAALELINVCIKKLEHERSVV